MPSVPRDERLRCPHCGDGPVVLLTADGDDIHKYAVEIDEDVPDGLRSDCPPSVPADQRFLFCNGCTFVGDTASARTTWRAATEQPEAES
jgi:hypothetical protein